MKAIWFLITVYLLLGSGAAWSQCPSNLSTEELITCINAQGAGCGYDDYIVMQQWDTNSTLLANVNETNETGAAKDAMPEMQTDISDSQ